MQLMKVDRARLQRTMDRMSEVGATPNGGVHRLALDDKDREARDLLKAWCEEAGFPMRIDRIGNMFAQREGRSAERPPILIGSHLDSQPMAGRFDGAVGVLTALEVLRTLDDHRVVTECPIELVNWTNEEGARFRPPLLASGVFAGVYDLDFALAQQDDAGCTIAEELARIGYAGTQAPTAPIGKYIEVHIEQGTVLEQAEVTIGNVTGVVGIRDTKVTVIGEDVHAGPLPMHLRRDALVGAAKMVLAANETGLANAPDARATIGRLAVPSNSHSVVPGRVEMVLDVRHPEAGGIEALQAELEERFREIAAERKLEVLVEEIWSYPPIEFDADLRACIGAAAEAHGYPHMELCSRAGHDAWNIARIAPAAMIFIPCRGGISHNEREFAEEEHIAAGADVLLAAALAASAAC
jgi:beta-ureidopropionase / N-carbamoyl-L-amino-acid hydrolase